MQRWNFTEDNNICSFRSHLYWHSNIRHNLFSSYLGWKACALLLLKLPQINSPAARFWDVPAWGEARLSTLNTSLLHVQKFQPSHFPAQAALGRQTPRGRAGRELCHGEGHLVRRAWGTSSDLVCCKDFPTLHSGDSYTCPVLQRAAWEAAAGPARRLHPTPMKQGWKSVLPRLALEIISAIFFFSLKAAAHYNF